MASGVAPGYLIAVPQMLDGFFARTVVLMLHHDEDGAMGIVINRQLELPLDEVARQHDIEEFNAEGWVYFGGPVDGFRGFVLHRGHKSEDDTEFAEGIFLTGSVAVLKKLLVDGTIDFRLYLGYAGWGPGQLNAEMKAGSWLTTDFTPRYIFDVDAAEVWETALNDMGIDPATVMQSDGEVQ